jgi:hypothetical protein
LDAYISIQDTFINGLLNNLQRNEVVHHDFTEPSIHDQQPDVMPFFREKEQS